MPLERNTEDESKSESLRARGAAPLLVAGRGLGGLRLRGPQSSRPDVDLHDEKLQMEDQVVGASNHCCGYFSNQRPIFLEDLFRQDSETAMYRLNRDDRELSLAKALRHPDDLLRKVTPNTVEMSYSWLINRLMLYQGLSMRMRAHYLKL
ncbi:hypothetical protein EJB05_42542, partial [Eragrostis curvula]